MYFSDRLCDFYISQVNGCIKLATNFVSHNQYIDSKWIPEIGTIESQVTKSFLPKTITSSSV